MKTNPLGSCQVLQIVFSKNLEGHPTDGRIQISGSVFDFVFGGSVGILFDCVLAFSYHVVDCCVFFVVNKDAAVGQRVNKNPELFFVIFKSRKDIDVVPRDSADQCDVGFVQVKLGPPVNWRGQVFVSFQYDEFVVSSQMHHGFKTFQLRAHHIVCCHLVVVEYVKHHGSNGCFSVRPADDHTCFVFGLLV